VQSVFDFILQILQCPAVYSDFARDGSLCFSYTKRCVGDSVTWIRRGFLCEEGLQLFHFSGRSVARFSTRPHKETLIACLAYRVILSHSSPIFRTRLTHRRLGSSRTRRLVERPLHRMVRDADGMKTTRRGAMIQLGYFKARKVNFCAAS
jgi:hypothetical protein